MPAEPRRPQRLHPGRLRRRQQAQEQQQRAADARPALRARLQHKANLPLDALGDARAVEGDLCRGREGVQQARAQLHCCRRSAPRHVQQPLRAGRHQLTRPSGSVCLGVRPPRMERSVVCRLQMDRWQAGRLVGDGAQAGRRKSAPHEQWQRQRQRTAAGAPTLPLPEGPMSASISPGSQLPLTLKRTCRGAGGAPEEGRTGGCRRRYVL